MSVGEKLFIGRWNEFIRRHFIRFDRIVGDRTGVIPFVDQIFILEFAFTFDRVRLRREIQREIFVHAVVVVVVVAGGGREEIDIDGEQIFFARIDI